MTDHMKIHKMTDCQPFPFLMVDNFFTEKQLEGIWKELNFYEGKTVLDTANIAKNAGKAMAQVKRIYLERVYRAEGRALSDILTNFDDNLFNQTMVQAYKKTTPSWLHFWSSNLDHTQLGYMENSDFYTGHFDVSYHTCLVWLFKQPKKFEGGDLIFTQPKIKVDCTYNRMVLFPSYYMHAVSELKMQDRHLNQGNGRWVLTKFIERVNMPNEMGDVSVRG